MSSELISTAAKKLVSFWELNGESWPILGNFKNGSKLRRRRRQGERVTGHFLESRHLIGGFGRPQHKVLFWSAVTQTGLLMSKYFLNSTGFSSQIRTKSRDRAIWPVRASCHFWAALSSNDSKTRYINSEISASSMSQSQRVLA